MTSAVYTQYPITNRTSIAYLSRIDPVTNMRIFNRLVGISVTDIENQELPPTYRNEYKIVGGVQTYVEKTLIAPLTTRYTFTMSFADGLWLRTVLSPYVQPANNCPVDIIIRPTCIDECEDYAFIFPHAVFGPIKFGSLIEIHGDGGPVEGSVEVTASEPILISAIKAKRFGQNEDYKAALYCNHCTVRTPPKPHHPQTICLLIDDFSTDCDAGDLVCPADIGNSSGVTALNANTIGGERDMWHEMINCITTFPQQLFCSSGSFVIAQAVSQGNFNLIYDGVDGDPFVNAQGLNLDLSTATRFRIVVDFSDDATNSSTIHFDVYSGSGNMSTTSFTTGLILAPTDFDFPLNSFTIASGTGVDWANVTSIHIHINDPALRALDIVFDSILVDIQVEPSPPPDLITVSCCDECYGCCRRGYAITDDEIYFTSDGFNSVFALSDVNAPVGMTYVDSVCSDNGVLYVSYDDGVGSGALVVYTNSGAVTALVYSGGPIFYDGTYVWTIDYNTKNVYVSMGGETFFTYSVGTAPVASFNPTDLTYDKLSECLYCVGQQGGQPKLYKIDEVAYTDMTPQIQGLDLTAMYFESVHTVSDGYILFGDDNGNVYRGLGNCDNITLMLLFKIGNSPISVIIGDESRVLIGSSNRIYEYSVLTEGVPQRVKIVGTPTGNFVSGSPCYSTGDIFNGFNGGVFITDVGELYKITPCSHDICQ